MTAEQHQFLYTLISSFAAPRPKQSVADWCCEFLQFNEPNNSGPFSLAGREYSREILDSQADSRISDEVLVFGSQAGKTGIIMGKTSWTVVNNPSRIFCVMPTRDTVLKFSRTRWQAMVRASPVLAKIIPVGARRFDFSTFQQILGGSIIDFTWSNSPAALASVPAPMVVLDEVDKFDEGGRREANAVELAMQRTKSFAIPKRIQSSTPTLVEGLIWQQFLKSDQRRRYLPCPHCGKFVVLIWSKQYTVFKCDGSEAVARWDKEAKRADNTWDLDRVERSARYECPHCGGHIQDAHKTIMDRNGEWMSTAPAARGYRGWHLSSLYAASSETNVGKLAVKFLQAKNSLVGLQGFINGDLAEPYQSQDTLTDRVELIRTTKAELTAEWKPLLTVDCQAKAPYFYYIVRAWNGGDSNGIVAGTCDAWEDLRSIQQAHHIPDWWVGVDSGFGARSDADVYLNCARFGEFEPRKNGRPLHVGWLPMKGMPGRKRWKDREKGVMLPYYDREHDPFLGSSDAGQVSIVLLEFSGDFFKDILDALRKGKSGKSWSVSQEMATDAYWRQLDAERKEARFNKITGVTRHEWTPRSKHWPNHWGDCEVESVVLATYLEFFEIPESL
jgi:hypothetical protein